MSRQLNHLNNLELQNNVKRLCQDVAGVKQHLTAVDDKHAARFLEIEKKQDSILQYLQKIETLLTPLTTSLTEQTQSIQSMMEKSSTHTGTLDLLKEALIMRHLKVPKACLAMKNDIDWNTLFADMQQESGTDPYPSEVKLEVIDNVMKRRENLIRNFHYKSVKMFFNKYVKEFSKEAIQSLPKSLMSDFVKVIRKASNKGKKYADCFDDDELIALVYTILRTLPFVMIFLLPRLDITLCLKLNIQ